jgi:hypothetical protein
MGRKNLNAIVFSLSARLLLLEKEPGGADASVARVGDCSLFQAAGVLGGGEHFACDSSCWRYGAGSLGLEELFLNPDETGGGYWHSHLAAVDPSVWTRRSCCHSSNSSVPLFALMRLAISIASASFSQAMLCI